MNRRFNRRERVLGGRDIALELEVVETKQIVFGLRRKPDLVALHYARFFAFASRRWSLFNTRSALTYLPVFLAFAALTSPRAMNSCRALRSSMLRVTASSTNPDRVSPSSRTDSASSRSSGDTRSEGMVVVFMCTHLHCTCDAQYTAAAHGSQS